MDTKNKTQREIKFRQAIFSNGKFSRWHHWGFIKEGMFVGVELGVSNHKEAQERSQQYIGLKDKNGKEIYEGDILKDDESDVLEVRFGILPLNKSGDCVCTYPAFYCKDFGALGSSPTFECREIGNWMRVIGNIYENPELLS